MPGVGADDGSCADHPRWRNLLLAGSRLHMKQLGPPAEVLVDEVGHRVFILLRRSMQCLRTSRTPPASRAACLRPISRARTDAWAVSRTVACMFCPHGRLKRRSSPRWWATECQLFGDLGFVRGRFRELSAEVDDVDAVEAATAHRRMVRDAGAQHRCVPRACAIAKKVARQICSLPAHPAALARPAHGPLACQPPSR